MILYWDKPKLEEDVFRWKAKLIGAKSKNPQVEIRKTTKGTSYSHMLIIVALNGYNFGTETVKGDRWSRNTKEINVRITSSGPIQMSFEEFEELKGVVEEAQIVLTNL